MYDIVIKVHIVVSTCFFISGVVLLTLSVAGWVNKKEGRMRQFNRFSIIFLTLLYLQLTTGLLLYFFLKPDISASMTSLAEAMEKSALRFWAIEHVSLMIFALILSQIGWLFIRHLKENVRKYKAASFYYGISFLVVLTSAAMALFR